MTPCDRYTHAQTAWGFCNLNVFFSSEQRKVDEILIFSPKKWVHPSPGRDFLLLGQLFKKTGQFRKKQEGGQLSSTLASSRNGKRLEAKPYK